MDNRLVFLDFDGVLYNTATEAYTVISICSGLIESIEELNLNTAHYQEFIKYRFLVGPAWNYKYMLEYMGESDFQAKFENAVVKATKEDYASFENIFFKVRKILQNENYIEWLKLNKPYTFLGNMKEIINKNLDNFFIITTKDKATVLKLLEFKGVKFNKSQVYDKEYFEKYSSKSKIIKHIMCTQNTNKAIFVDDSKNHLKDCIGIENLLLFQASWGYISQQDEGVRDEKYIYEQIFKLIY
jgi:hypothetical protein